MHTLTDLPRALRAEVYKLRHSSILVTILVLPVAVVLVMNLLLPVLTGRPFARPGNPWLVTMIGMLQVWSFIQAFIVAVVTAQLAGLEHNNHMWKHLFALPVSRRALILAKMLVALALFGLSLLVLTAGTIVTGWFSGLLKPELALNAPLPWVDLIGVVLMTYIASWLMIAIHAWAGVNWANFGPSIGLAMIGFLLSLFLVASPAFQRIFPWSLPTNFFVAGFNLTGNLIYPDIAITSILISALASLPVILLGAWFVTRRDVI